MSSVIFIEKALERLETEEDLQTRQHVIYEALDMVCAIIRKYAPHWSTTEIMQVGIYMGAASAYANEENTRLAIEQIQKLNTFFDTKGNIDG